VNEYLGVLLIVSHDRFFLDKTVDHLFVLPGDGVGEVLDCYGSLSACASARHCASNAATRAPTWFVSPSTLANRISTFRT
jgi:ATP-binding cassette subfamily F protein uup